MSFVHTLAIAQGDAMNIFDLEICHVQKFIFETIYGTSEESPVPVHFTWAVVQASFLSLPKAKLKRAFLKL